MEPTGSDAYKERRLLHSLAKLYEAEQSMIEYFAEQGKDTTQQKKLLEDRKLCMCLFRDLSPELQHQLTLTTIFAQAEIPVLASLISKEEWILVSTRRIVWSLNGAMTELTFSELAQVGSSLGPKGQVSDWIDQSTKEYPASLEKIAHNSSPWIYFEESNGIQHEVIVPGLIKNNLLECLRFMLRMDRIHSVEPTKK